MGAITQVVGLGSYAEAYRELEHRTLQQPDWLRTLRQNAFARFCDVGFPTLKDEDWRFTNVAAIARETFSPAADRSSEFARERLEPFRMPGAACMLVFVNGHFAPQLSERADCAATVEAGGLAEALSSNAVALQSHMGRYLNTQRDAFCSLNTAFLEDGAYIRIPKGTVLKAPLHLLFVSVGNGEPQIAYPRNLIVAETGTQVDIVEEHVSLGEGVFFSNLVTELVAEENAVVSHHVIERENREAFHVSTLRIQQARSANVRSHSVLLGAALVRNNIHPVLAGEGAECLLNGLFVGEQHQHMDNYMLLEHVSPHCNSRQFYNGILDGEAHGVFHGRIIVHKDAQKTDAKQTNRNLLLSDSTQIDTKPQLEIYADDVKCTHGATIGQVDEEALFYLRSRGIEEGSARKLLLFAFAGECLGRMAEGAARTHIESIIHQSLPGGVNPTIGRGLETGRAWEEVR
ncbi:MAG TPA: Fe-S cluster assembly protein SufD [Acidisarcina sp.]|nr:Fe-S cluster assembly protein SufD [Acidisarcina sp.]